MRKARRGRGRDLLLASLLTPERQAQGLVEALTTPIEDANGEWSRPLRALDTLDRMERAGSITPAERRAGGKFHDLFRLAHLDKLYAADTTRIPVVLANGNNGRSIDEGSEAARLSVQSALDALGGHDSPGGSCAWHVLGCELSLEAWAMRVAWGDRRRVHNLTATGILLTDLAILRAHYGF